MTSQDHIPPLTAVVLSFSKSCSWMYACPMFLSILMGASPPALFDQSRGFTPIMSPQRVWTLITHSQTHYYRQRHPLCLFLTPTYFSSTSVCLLCLHLHNATTIMSINLAKSPMLQDCGLPFPVPDHALPCAVCSLLLLLHGISRVRGALGVHELVSQLFTERFCSCLTRGTSSQGHVHTRAFSGKRTCDKDNCFEP